MAQRVEWKLQRHLYTSKAPCKLPWRYYSKSRTLACVMLYFYEASLCGKEWSQVKFDMLCSCKSSMLWALHLGKTDKQHFSLYFITWLVRPRQHDSASNQTAEINSAVITGARKKREGLGGTKWELQCQRQKFGNLSKIKPPKNSNHHTGVWLLMCWC